MQEKEEEEEGVELGTADSRRALECHAPSTTTTTNVTPDVSRLATGSLRKRALIPSQHTETLHKLNPNATNCPSMGFLLSSLLILSFFFPTAELIT